MSRTGYTNGRFLNSFIYIFIKLLQAHPSSSLVVALCCTTEVTEESVFVFNHAKPFKICQKRSQSRFYLMGLIRGFDGHSRCSRTKTDIEWGWGLWLGSRDSGVNSRQVSWIIPLLPPPSTTFSGFGSSWAGVCSVQCGLVFRSLSVSYSGCSWSSVKESEITTILL